jgi:transcriptional regulator of heat shock response
MLTITTKKYIIEELIKAEDEEHNTQYEFTMQITPEEMKEIDNIFFNKEGITKIKELESAGDDNKKEIEEEFLNLLIESQNKFEDIVFKNHKEPFKNAVGEYRYDEMLEMMFDFFWNAFTEKKAKRANTMNTDLRKIIGK